MFLGFVISAFESAHKASSPGEDHLEFVIAGFLGFSACATVFGLISLIGAKVWRLFCLFLRTIDCHTRTGAFKLLLLCFFATTLQLHKTALVSAYAFANVLRILAGIASMIALFVLESVSGCHCFRHFLAIVFGF